MTSDSNNPGDGSQRRVIDVAKLDSPLHQIKLDAVLSPQAQDRLLALLEPYIAMAVDPLREMTAKLVAPYAAQVERATQPLRELHKNRGRVVHTLVERTGWIIPTESVGEFAPLVERDADATQLEVALVASFSSPGPGFASTWRLVKDADWLNHRREILHEARRCIDLELHSAAVTLLVQSSEGIILDWLFDVLAGDEKLMAGTARPQKQAPDRIRERMSADWLKPTADAAIALLDKGSPEFDATRVFGTFKFGELPEARTAATINRHAIAHGVACGYGTPVCAARAVALLGFVVEFVGMTRLLQPLSGR